VTEDLSSYQSSETAWRYDSAIFRAECDIKQARLDLDKAEKRLKDLKDKPPLYHLFNWSA
jgi:hypothetical protein